MAKIDVILPVKNGIAYLAESLDSICQQSFKDWRLLVLDHGSTDGSRELAERYHERDARVEVHSFPEADGLAGLLNKGLDISDCQYVMRHDADDIALPGRMEHTLDAFAASPGAIVVGGMSTIIDADGQVIGESHNATGRDRLTATSLFFNAVIHPAACLDYNEVQRMGIRYGRDFIQALPQDKQLQVHNLAEDYFLFGQLGILGKVFNIPTKLIKYRWHGANVSATKFVDQMGMSIAVSRNLARTMSAMYGFRYIDPAPFCNHGGILFDVDGQADFEQDFDALADNLRHIIGRDCAELERELAYRRVLSTRHPLKLLGRYARVRSRYAPENCEWLAVKSWFTRHLPNKHNIIVPTDHFDPVAV